MTATVLRIRACLSCSHSIRIFFVPGVHLGCFRFYFSCHTVTKTFRSQLKYRGPGSILSSYLCRMHTYCGPFCLSDYPNHKIKCWLKWQPSHHSVLQLSLAPLVFLYFGLHFRAVTYLCRNRFQDTMLYMTAVAITAVTSSSTYTVGLFLLSEHGWPTRVTPLIISCHIFVCAAYAIKSIVLYQVPKVNQPFI